MSSAGVTVVTLTRQELAQLVSEAVTLALDEHEAPERPALLDRKGLAVALSCSPSTVSRLQQMGCPTIRLVDSPRFELGSVLEWLATQPAQEKTKWQNSVPKPRLQKREPSRLRLVPNPQPQANAASGLEQKPTR